MPALVLFGRKWQVGTDDFVISSFVDLFIRLIWLIAGLVIFWKNEQTLHCSDGNYTKIFYYGFFTIAHCNILLDILLLQNSRKGSIMDPSPRKFVPYILYARIFTEMAEITWNILATIGICRNMFNYCDNINNKHSEPIILIHGFIIFDWIMLFFQLLLFIYIFDPLGRSSRPFDEYQTNSVANFKVFGIEMPLAKTKYSKKWQRRCRCALFSWCCVKDDEVMDSYREVSKLYGTMLAEDIVVSDVLAGIVLLSLKTKEERIEAEKTSQSELRSIAVENAKQRKKANNKVYPKSTIMPITKEPVANGMLLDPVHVTTISDDAESLSDENLEEWKTPQRIQNFVRFACAAYGYIYPLVESGKCQIGGMVKNCICCSCLPGKKHPVGQVEGDNCCSCCLSGIKTTLEDIPFADIVYASFKDSTFVKPFYIALDHKTKTIVLACRGTLSFKDLLTDMTGWPDHIPGYPLSFKAHHGMLLSCLRLREKLNNLKIIDELISKYPDYGLVLTGQSLGAGMSTVLSLLLRPQYPQLKCYVFSPPGGLLSFDAAEYSKAFLVSVIYGDDFVARLGILQFERLKYKLMAALRDCKTPKYRLLLGGYCCCIPSPKLQYVQNTNEATDETKFTVINCNTEENSTLGEPAATIIPEQTDIQEASIHSNNNVVSRLSDKPTSNVPRRQAHEATRFPTIEGMYPPGNIFYIRKLPKSQRRIGEPKWIWYWADRLEFDDIIVSPKMILDHIPAMMPVAMKHVAHHHHSW